jgi:hypothetical protein
MNLVPDQRVSRQAPHHASAPTVRAEGSRPPKSRQFPSSAATRVQFGGAFGNAVVNKTMLPTFEKITEVFIWGFLAQDMIALWLSRILNSLRVGRVPYDPKDDPQARNQPFHRQVKKWIAGNVKGLNWINCREDSARETLTGPGLLAVLGAGFMLARQCFKSKPMELSYDHMNALGKGFQQHLQTLEASQGHLADLPAYQKAVGQYITSIFADPVMAKTPLHTVLEKDAGAIQRALDTSAPAKKWDEQLVRDLQEHPVLRPVLEREKKLAKQLQSLFGKPENATQIQNDIRQQLARRPMLHLLADPKAARQGTYKRYLETWAGKWQEAIFEKGRGRSETLGILERDLEDTLESFNRKQRILAYDFGDPAHLKRSGLTLTADEAKVALHIKDETPLHRVSQTWMRCNPGPGGMHAPKQQDLRQTTEALNRWGDFATQVWERKQATVGKEAGTKLSDIVEGMTKKLVACKYLFGIGITALAGLYLLRVAFWAQSNDSYQATRLLRRKSHGNSSPPPPQAATNPSTPVGISQPSTGFQVGLNPMGGAPSPITALAMGQSSAWQGAPAAKAQAFGRNPFSAASWPPPENANRMEGRR